MLKMKTKTYAYCMLALGLAASIFMLAAYTDSMKSHQIAAMNFCRRSEQRHSAHVREFSLPQGKGANLVAQRTQLRHGIKFDKSEICDDKGNENLIVVWVDTAPHNVNKRNKIRSTWGSVRWHNNTTVRTLFFLGAVEDAQLQSAISSEAALHGDMVQDSSYVDTYRNLTRKGLSALSWIAAHCPSPLRVVKVDDDTLVDPYNLIHFLRASNESILQRFICETSIAYPERSTLSKYYVPYEEFENDTWPIFCQGYGYIIPPIVVLRILEASKVVRLVSMEDVYITGILGKYLGMSHLSLTQEHAIMTKFLESDFKTSIEQKRNLIFVGHEESLTNYEEFWKIISTRLQ